MVKMFLFYTELVIDAIVGDHHARGVGSLVKD